MIELVVTAQGAETRATHTLPPGKAVYLPNDGHVATMRFEGPPGRLTVTVESFHAVYHLDGRPFDVPVVLNTAALAARGTARLRFAPADDAAPGPAVARVTYTTFEGADPARDWYAKVVETVGPPAPDDPGEVVVEKFLESDGVVYGPDLKCPFSDFAIRLRAFAEEKSYSWRRSHRNIYNIPFVRRGLRVQRTKVNGRTCDAVIGLDLGPAAVP